MTEHTELILKDISQLNNLEWLPADLQVIKYLVRDHRTEYGSYRELLSK